MRRMFLTIGRFLLTKMMYGAKEAFQFNFLGEIVPTEFSILKSLMPSRLVYLILCKNVTVSWEGAAHSLTKNKT